MKKIAVLSALSAGLMFSCSDLMNLEAPQSIVLKTNATYSLPLGVATAYLKDHASAKKIQEIIEGNIKADDGDPSNDAQSSQRIEVFDLNDKKNVQKYILDYPIAEIPLDMSSYLNSLDNLDLSSTKNSFDKEFEIQKLDDMDFSQSVTFDFQDMICNAVNQNSPVSLVLPQIGDTNPQKISLPEIPFDFTNPDFNSIEFEHGSIILTFTEQGDSDGGDARILSSVQLYDNYNRLISASSADPDNFVVIRETDGTLDKLVIPMEGKSIGKKLKLKFNIAGSYGTLGNFTKLKAKFSFSDDVKIRKITGLTVADSDLASYAMDVDQIVPTGELKNYLKTATIEEGSMSYSLKVPSAWKGIYSQPTLALTGDLVIPASDFSDVRSDSSYIINKTVDLHGKILAPNDGDDFEGIKFAGKIPIKIQNATIVLNDDDELVFKANASIKSLSNAQIYMNDLFGAADLSKSFEQELGEEVTKYIKEIKINEVGLGANVTTNLPSNDMNLDVKIDSVFFGISNLKDTLDFSGDSPYILNLLEDYDGNGNVVNFSNNKVDFAIDMDLKGGNPVEPGLVTFSLIELGAKYNFAFEMEFIYDWEYITLQANAAPISGEFDSGFNLKSLLSSSMNDDLTDILDKVRFAGDRPEDIDENRCAIQGCLSVTKPDIDGLEKFKGFNGTLGMDYSDQTDRTVFSGTVNFIQAGKTLSECADADRVINTDNLPLELKSVLDGTTDSAKLNGPELIAMLNSRAEDLKFKYNLSLVEGESGSSDITLYKQDIEALKDGNKTTSIKIGITLVFALQLYTMDDIVIPDVMKMFGKELVEDVFRREDAEQNKEFTDLVKELRLTYLFSNNSGFTLNANIVATNTSGEKYIDKKIDILGSGDWKNDKRFINFSRKDINSIFSQENYPFIPLIKMTIPKTDLISVPRNAYFRAQAVFGVETGGEYKLWGGDD